MFRGMLHSLGKMKERSTKTKRLVIFYLKNIDVTFRAVGKIVVDVIYQVKGVIDMVAEKYKTILSKYKAKSALFRTKLYETLKGEIIEFIDDTVVFLDQFELVHKVVHLYNQVLSWIEEHNILKKLESSCIQMKEYVY